MPSNPTLHLRSTRHELGNDNPIPVTVRLYCNFQPMSWRSMSSQLSGRWCWDSFPRHHFICYTIWHCTVVPFDQELAQLRYSLTCLFLQATAMALFSLNSSSGVHFLIYHLPGSIDAHRARSPKIWFLRFEIRKLWKCTTRRAHRRSYRRPALAP
jgi:hypothetical protein